MHYYLHWVKTTNVRIFFTEKNIVQKYEIFYKQVIKYMALDNQSKKWFAEVRQPVIQLKFVRFQ